MLNIKSHGNFSETFFCVYVKMCMLKQHYFSPIFIDISPIAQVALLQTEMNSGFRLAPRIGIKSPTMKIN